MGFRSDLGTGEVAATHEDTGYPMDECGAARMRQDQATAAAMRAVAEVFDPVIADLQAGANDLLLIIFIAIACAVGVLIGY